MPSVDMALRDKADFQRIDADFPPVGKTLELLWGHPEFHVFVLQLGQETR